MPEINGEELLNSYNFSISFGDIAQLDICKGGSCQNLSHEQLVEVLYNNGLDIKKDYQIVHDTHRGLTNQIFTTNRVVGFIRQDKAWLEEVGADPEVVANQLLTERKYRGSEDMFEYK